MRFNQIGLLLAAIVGDGEALHVSDRVKNRTTAVQGAIEFAVESSSPLPSQPALPPAVPPRPAPKPPEGPYLTLFDNASDEAWEKAKCKGANFVRAMHGSDRDAGQVFKPARDSAASPFENLDIDAAEKWGWDFTDSMIYGDFKDWGVDHVLRDLGLSDKCHAWGGWMDCITFTHGLKQDEEGDWEADPSTYEVDGKTYRRSGAHYSIAFDAQRGVIIALDRDSPQSTGKDINPPVQGDELPAIKASSDIMWLYWKMLDKPKGPNYFMSTCIINAETQGIVSRAIREVMPDAQSFPAWGGYDFDTDTPEGQAILGTPNAQAFSYLLLEHKATLGNLYISQVRVFRDNKDKPIGPSLLFVVEPVPVKNGTKSPSETYGDISSLFERIKNLQHAADTVSAAAKSPADLPAPKPLVVEPKPVDDLFSKNPNTYLDLYPDADDEEWNKAQCKGANFARAMRASDSEAGKIFNPPRDTAAGLYSDQGIDELEKWGWLAKADQEPDMKYYGIDHVLRDMGASDKLIDAGGDIQLVSFRHGVSRQLENGDWQTIGEQRYEVDGKSYSYTGAWYNFAMDEVNGVMIATDRMSPQEIGIEAEPPITGDGLPLIRAFSDIAWISWAALVGDAEADIKGIHYFMTVSISNRLTQRILSRCIREALPGAWGFPAWPGFEFETTSPQGQAILGTPNAQAFSYFLLQHKKELGNLHISKVRVFHDSNWIAKANLLLIVEPVPVGGEEGQGLQGPTESPVGEALVQERASSTSQFLRGWWNRAKL